MLRSNRKGEFNSKEFAILSEDIGIKKQLIAPYTTIEGAI